MEKLSTAFKINLQLSENSKNLKRSTEACEQAGLDTQYTMGKAIMLFLETYNLPHITDQGNEFHDAMHITALAHEPSVRGETLAGVAEQTLLREPYNGNENEMIQKGCANPYAIYRRYNPSREEDFEKPVPVASLKDAMALGQERQKYSKMRQKSEETISTEEMRQTYDHAVETDAFFRQLMGGRAIYQLSTTELMQMPIAFFGIQKTGEQDTLSFERISQEQKDEVLTHLGEDNITLHILERVRTADELHQLFPQLPDPSTEQFDL